MREIYPSGFNSFVTPFMLGMLFVLGWCLIGAVRVLTELPDQDRKKLFLSFLNPKTMAKNLRDWFLDCLIHVKLWKRNKLLGYMHSSIAFGWFMIIIIGHIEVFLYTPERIHRLWYPIFFRYFVAVSDSTMKGSLLFFLMDFFLLIILSGIALAMIKRLHSRLFGMRRTTRASLTDLIGLYALWSIFPLRLLAEGFTADISGGSFLTKSLNSVLHLFYSDPTHADPVWWAYSMALGLFLCIIPFSRYMHIPAEILLIPMRNAGIPIRHSRKGVSRLQVHSCPSCGVCIDACPLSAVPANVRDTTVYLNRQLKRNNRRRIEEISDKCLLCGKCSAVCPVGVEGDKLRIAQRATRKYGIPADYSMIDENGFVKDKGRRVLYFAGCMTHLTPSIKRALTSILEAAGEVVQREFVRPGAEPRDSRAFPGPAPFARRPHFAADLPSIDQDAEAPGVELRHPVLRAKPNGELAAIRRVEARPRRADGPPHARRHEIRRTHQVRELRVNDPRALVVELRRLQPDVHAASSPFPSCRGRGRHRRPRSDR